jgi:hypothetical protein
MAKDFHCPVICLGQLNRSVKSRANKRPMMSDIRESGSVEQDADVILFLYREAYYDKDSQDQTLEIIVSKNRNGPVGTIAVNYNEYTGKIEENYIHHLLEEGNISLDDNISKIDLDQADHQKVAEMIQTNVLGFHKVGIYSLKMNQNEFVFIFAESEQKAIQFYTETFHQNPLNCHKYSLDFELARGNGVISFRDMKKEFMSFPVIVGYYKRVG